VIVVVVVDDRGLRAGLPRPARQDVVLAGGTG
jgi:hypothetical protein